jgi:hypothetical protein
MRLLGALAPKTEDGTIVGPNKIVLVAATAELFKNCRRLIMFDFLVFLLFMFQSCNKFSIIDSIDARGCASVG